ncbi:zinc finger protein 385C isoform X7 [Alligator sinensis]|uniref:Zinc finger protein 385C isoform X7 n=1 Tax=Alligator sinensis TaxID=38654 RepID=A0A3Q0HF95_ALLSI|nr:zinc finger protein 385C isoform X7 [Alligator sinensis]
MDPVQKAVINHTFGVPSPLKKKQFISCNICHLRFNSAGSCIHLRQGVNLPSSKYSGLQLGLVSSAAGQICHWNQAEAHYKGHKHARRLKAIEAMKNKQKIAAATTTTSQEKPADFPATLDGSGDPSSTVQANGLLALKEPDAECSSLMLTPTSEESSAELPSSIPSLVSPPVSELSEGASDATSVASSAAQGAEPQATELASSVSSAPDSEKEGKKSKPHLYCPTCKVTVNSLSQLEAHNTGAKHKSMLEGHTTQMRRGRGKVLSRAGHKSKRIGNKGSINIQNKAFHCQVCEIYVNSETQLKQHMNSRRHKDRLAGKPPKPKYSPYNKLQKNAALAVSILKLAELGALAGQWRSRTEENAEGIVLYFTVLKDPAMTWSKNRSQGTRGPCPPVPLAQPVSRNWQEGGNPNRRCAGMTTHPDLCKSKWSNPATV